MHVSRVSCPSNQRVQVPWGLISTEQWIFRNWVMWRRVDEVRRKRGSILTNTKSCTSFLWTCTIPRTCREAAFGNKSSKINLSCYFIRIELVLLVRPNLWTGRHRRRYDLIWPELKPPFHFIAKPDWNRILGFLCFVCWKYSRPSCCCETTERSVGFYRAFIFLWMASLVSDGRLRIFAVVMWVIPDVLSVTTQLYYLTNQLHVSATVF